MPGSWHGAGLAPVRRLTRSAILVILACLVFTPAGADAIIRTQAMLASTIAEYSVEEGRVLLELEIGADDIKAFGNLLPDAIYEQLGNAPVPLAERLAIFSREDLFVEDGEGRRSPARILEIGPGERIRRDEISGEPLPATGDEAELVVRAKLEYALAGNPGRLHLGGRLPGQASIGFVVYHKKVAVNDFRYLGPSQALSLDWNDPWYTSFDVRSLRRTYFAPMNGFIYVEPYEVRKEIIVRPKDLQDWVDLDLTNRETIPVEIQGELKRTALEYLGQRQPLEIDGQPVEADYTRIDFLERTLKSSRIIDPPEELDINSAMLGVIFIYLTEGLPQKVSMNWDLFNERIQMIPASTVDQAGPLPTYLEPDSSVLEWQNFLKNPKIPTLTEIAPPPGMLARAQSALRWPLAVASLALVGWCAVGLRRRQGLKVTQLMAVVVAVALTTGSFWAGRGALLTGERAHGLVADLLHNVYRAFDFHQEERIYDVLEKSVEGDLLTQIYLEARKGLELASQGGARAKVKEVAVVEIDAQPGDGGSFTADVTWIVGGSVGHWGHIHQRRNRYRANLDVRPVAGQWKLTALDVLEEERL